MIEFGVLHPDGTLTDTRTISQAAIIACPHVILVAEHYRPDGSCRCNDPGHNEMAEWEYTWDDARGVWI
jgi:hypothetical protein